MINSSWESSGGCSLKEVIRTLNIKDEEIFFFFGANVREGKEQGKQGERECFNRTANNWFSLEQKRHEGTEKWGWSKHEYIKEGFVYYLRISFYLLDLTCSITSFKHRNIIIMLAMFKSWLRGCVEGIWEDCKSEVMVTLPKSRENIRLDLKQDWWLFVWTSCSSLSNLKWILERLFQ